jgi:hypothetical protein
MTIFETKRHIEINADFQGINLTEFSFNIDSNIDNDQIINTFIKSRAFTYDSLRDCVKKEPDKGYLGRTFNFDKVKITDFKKYSKNETTKFLIDFLNEPDWGEDRIEFSNLLDKYFEIHKKLISNDFYIISKNWFDINDERLIEPESWCYTYYFLIISVNRNSNLLTLTEWTYD